MLTPSFIENNTICILNFDLTVLPSYVTNKKLRENATTYEYSKYYNEVNDLKWYKLTSDLFKNLSKNISWVHEEDAATDEFVKKRCYDLNYWLCDEVYNKLKPYGLEGELQNVIPRIHGVWKKIVENEFKDKNYKCYPDEKLIFNMSYLNDIKDLFDFFEDFALTKKDIIANTEEACHKYRKYLQTKIPIYYTWRDSCQEEGFICKRYIDNYEKYRPAGILLQLNPMLFFTYSSNECFKEVHDLFRDSKKEPKRNDDIYIKIMEKLKRERPGKSLISANVGEGLRGSEFFIPGDNDNFMYRLTVNGFYFTVEVIIPILLFLLGMFLIFHILYKFTPFGRSMLRTRAKVRQRIRPNLDYEDIVLLYGSEESLDNYSDDNSYNLNYSSSLS
ncbi:CYIR protein [Plasmodium cynomolgi strain B]|uniref:CYIR protein n=1 Tax=Plasmodium cynomolgi (strain B) TaxID=1120755 RepID=K6UF51_PLACD|nr:CYIR protein [Plasmodium cynomolgi strain B]GAB69491.1 CYIR protein [Plasmodium cynomolgi strain B]